MASKVVFPYVRSRIRENSDRITDHPNSHEFGYRLNSSVFCTLEALAISAYYVDIQERLGGRDDPRLIPLLAGMLELLPWLKQWHNVPNAELDGMRGDYFDTFITEEARQLGKTIPEIKAWQPPQRTRNRVRR